MTLHQTTELFHKLLKLGIIFGSAIFALLLVINITRMMLKILFPPPPDYPNVAFGKLTPITFPQSIVQEKFNYSLNTLSGTLPSFPDRVNVYRTISQPVTLLNVQNARSKVKLLGFVDEPQKQYREFTLNPTRYQWQVISNDLLRTIEMNTDTYDFKLLSTYRNYPLIFNQTAVANEAAIRTFAEGIFDLLSLDVDDIDMENVKIQNLTLVNGALVQAENVSKTQIIRLDLYQKKINDLPIYYPEYPNSLINFLFMARAHGIDDILEANYTHQKVGEELAVYPIKTAQEAFEELKQGKAFISNYFGSSRTIPITDVVLGYFINENKQDYLMPVILFQSKQEFFAFVSAVKESCLTTNKTTVEECQGKQVSR